MFIKIILLIVFVLINLATANYQAQLFKKNIRINKTLWAVGYCLLAAIPLIWNAWILTITLIVMRFIVFDPALNIERDKPFFYSNPDDPEGSKLDKFFGKHKEYYYYAALIVFIGLIVILFK